MRPSLRKNAKNNQNAWKNWRKSKSLVQKHTWQTDLLHVHVIFQFLKKCDYKEHKPPRILEIRENLFLDALLRCKTCFSLKRFYGITKVAHTKNFKKCKIFKKMQKTGKNVTFAVFTPNSRINILYFFNYSVFGRFCQSIWVIFEGAVFSSYERK